MSFHTYRQRKLRSTQPILTRTQIRELGKMMGFSSFRQSVEFFMDPINYFKLSKVKMAEIHQYLVDKGITDQRCPNSHIRQGDHSRVLISILFPGYPIIKASEQHYRDMRENRTYQAKMIDLAYDMLPTTDKYERLDELFRTQVSWRSDCSVEIPLKKLNRAAVVEGHAESNFNVRLFFYMWSTERIPWHPDDTLTHIGVDDEMQPLSEHEKDLLRFGFLHIDITDKSSVITKANRRTTGSVKLSFKFTQPPNVRHVSVCAVWEKTPEELASQLYAQTASLYIGQATEKASRYPEKADQVQKKTVQALRPCGSPNDKLILAKTETLLMTCGEMFAEAWNNCDGEDQEEDDDIVAGDEVVSMMDPILLSIIQHPARCIFCTHRTCFDAQVFFRFQINSMNWQCPICCVKIRGIQDLYIDYHTKLALTQYPNQEKLIRHNDDTYAPIQDNTPEKASLKREPPEIITIQEEDEEPVKKKIKH